MSTYTQIEKSSLLLYNISYEGGEVFRGRARHTIGSLPVPVIFLNEL